MDTIILGSGAMGSLYGGLLAEDGNDVTLVDIWQEHIETINENGLIIETADETRAIDVAATTDLETTDTPDLIIIFVKSIHTAKALEDATGLLGSDTDVLTLQNGLGNPEIISEYVPAKNVIAGVTAHGATVRGPGHILHAGTGLTTIGRYFAENDVQLEVLASTFKEANIETSTSAHIDEEIWEKVLVNIGINASTALARVKNGELAETDSGRRLTKTAVQEAAQVARKEVEVRSDIVTHVIDVAQATSDNKSSMLQDIENNRQTEIERLHGEVVARAEEQGVAVPINQMLTDLIRLAESEGSSA
jgi:2-dehydropantoate 2-reductase